MHRLALLLFATTTGWTQPQLLRTLELPQAPSHVFIDRAGDVYIQFANGKIEKRGNDLRELGNTTPNPTLTSFDPTNAMRLLGFDRGTKTVTWFYPDLSVYEQFGLDPAFAIEPWWLCTSGERDFWVADAADQSLKKIRAADQIVNREFKLPDVVPSLKEMTGVREYQNFVFLAHPKKGIFVLNSFGKLLRAIPVSGLQEVQFLGEELFYIRDNQLVLFDLFSAETRTLDLPGRAETVLLSDERMFLLSGSTLKVFVIKP